MATIDTHLAELATHEAEYLKMVEGFTSGLNLPGLSDEERAELSEDLAEAQDRLIKVQNAIAQDQALKDDDYPNKLNLTASQSVIDTLNERLKKLQDAVNEIQPEAPVLADALEVTVA